MLLERLFNMTNLEDFLIELNDVYPEKVVSLLGLNYTDIMLISFLMESSLDIHTFYPNEFKKYLESLYDMESLGIAPYMYTTKPPKPYVGDMYHDINKQVIKIYDGKHWVITP